LILIDSKKPPYPANRDIIRDRLDRELERRAAAKTCATSGGILREEKPKSKCQTQLDHKYHRTCHVHYGN
jgi:hypothetical protein